MRYSRIHNFADVGVWISDASGAGVIVEGNEIYRDTSLNEDHGKTGVRVDLSDVAVVRNNTITLQGMNSTLGGAGIEIRNGKTFCLTNPASPESVLVENNDIIGPGGAVDTDATWAGISGNWACGSTNRTVYLGENWLRGWNGAALDLLQCKNVQLTCNDADSSAAGIVFSRNNEQTGVSVRFRHNKVRLHDFDAGDTTATLITTDNAAKLDLGPSSADKGVNELIVKGRDRYILEADDLPDSLDAQNNFWSRNAVWHGVVDSILTYVDPDTARVSAENPLAEDYGQPMCSPGATALARPVVSIVDEAGRAEPEASSITRLSVEALRTELISTGPNPFTWETAIRFSVGNGHAQAVRIEVFDVTGRRVARLVEGLVEPGAYRVSWTGRDGSGTRVAAGIYFLRMTAGEYTKVSKLVSLR